MSHECPNCREPISCWRAFTTTAFTSFRCSGCGSLLGIDVTRRILLVLPTVGTGLLGVLLLSFSLAAGLYVMLSVAFLPILVVLVGDRIHLIEARSFACNECGYDLHVQVNHAARNAARRSTRPSATE